MGYILALMVVILACGNLQAQTVWAVKPQSVWAVKPKPIAPALKTCHCSAQCTCGCNAGKECQCGKSSAMPAITRGGVVSSSGCADGSCATGR